MATINYVITKRNGEQVEFTTDLSVDDAADIVGGLPLTEFSGSLMLAYRSGRLSEAQRLWLLKLAHDATAPKAAGPYASLVETVTAMQARAKGRVQLRLRGVTVKAVTKGRNAGACYLYRGSEYVGKLTPEGVVNRVLEVKASFQRVDEWHSTSMDILLMLRTAKKVPDKLIETWVRNHWAEVQALAPSKTPAAAGPSLHTHRPTSARTLYSAARLGAAVMAAARMRQLEISRAHASSASPIPRGTPIGGMTRVPTHFVCAQVAAAQAHCHATGNKH